MKKTNEKAVKSYIQELKSTLICSGSMKKAFLSTIKQRISELEDEISVLSKENLYQEIGPPEEIANGLENRADITLLKKRARRYTIAKIVCSLCLALALLTAAILIIVVISDNDYHAATSAW